MRVASKTVYDAVRFNLGNITEELNKANEVIATSKRINSLADDPVGLTQALNIKAALSNIEQLNRNINTGKAWLVSSESALTHVQDLLSEIKSLCVQMATATTGSSVRASSAVTVQNIFEEMVALANTDVNGRYIFAGSKTDTAPFSQVGAYSGDNNAFLIKIGRNSTVEVGRDGADVFLPSGAGGDSDIFQTLTDLQTALTIDSVSGIQTAMTRLDNHFDQITNKISDIGSKTLRMEIKETIFQDMDITNTERLSKIEDADITEAIMNLKAKEVAYQAALASAARVLNISLVDYLR